MVFRSFVWFVLLFAFGFGSTLLPAVELPSEERASLEAKGHPLTAPIRKLVVVVPLYREFYNQNLGRLLQSLASQTKSRTCSTPLKIEVVFVVNNTWDASQEVRQENRETVAYLNALAEGRVPSVRPGHQDLLAAVATVQNSELKIRVIDKVDPGFLERNIGNVRNVGNQQVLASLPESEDPYTVIWQMDADTIIPANAAAKIQDVFSRGRYSFALLGMDYEVEPGSEKAVYQRHMVETLLAAWWEFEAAIKGTFVGGGGPRIVALASTLRRVGGIPQVPIGEDVQLIANLKEQFGPTGTNIVNLRVTTAFRARADSYDGKFYLERLGLSREIPSKLLEKESLLVEKENEIASWGPDWKEMLRQEREVLLGRLQERAVTLRSEITSNLCLVPKGQAPFAETWLGPSSISRTPWWSEFLKEQWESAGHDIPATILAIERIFPDQMQLVPTDRQILWARIRAATAMLHLKSIAPPLSAEQAVKKSPYQAPLPPPLFVTPIPVDETLTAPPFVLELDFVSSIITLRADSDAEIRLQPWYLTNSTERFTLNVHPRQRIWVNETNCSSILWVDSRLKVELHQTFSGGKSAVRTFEP